MSDTEEQPSKIRRVCREEENVTNEADDTTINDSETTVKESDETVIKVSKTPEAGAVLNLSFLLFYQSLGCEHEGSCDNGRPILPVSQSPPLRGYLDGEINLNLRICLSGTKYVIRS